MEATAVARDATGNTFITGWTDAPDFPVRNAPFPRGQSADAFLIKLDPSWNVVFATYLGGEDYDEASAVGLDAAGNIYLAGSTYSSTFAGIPFAQLGGAMDGFVLKLDPTGQYLIYAIALGGRGDDRINGMFVQSDGHVFVAGTTKSPDLPITDLGHSSLRGAQNAFIAELDPSGSLIYCTYLGGSGTDIANAIAANADGSVWVAGGTTSPDFPAVLPVQPGLQGRQNAFVAKLSPDGKTILFSSWLGGSGAGVTNLEQANAIALDPAGNAYVAGITSSIDFPTVNAVQPIFAGWNSDAFLSSFTPDGELRLSTYLGGGQADDATSIAYLTDGRILIAGFTFSADFPMAMNPSDYHDLHNGFLAVLSSAGAALYFATYVDQGLMDTTLALTASNPTVLVGSTKVASPTSAEVATAVHILVPPPPSYSLSTSASPSSAGTLTTNPSSPDGTYLAGTRVCVAAAPNAEWMFGSWTGDALDSAGCLILRSNAAVTATFTPVQYRLTLSVQPSGSGTVSAAPAPINGTYASGTAVCLTASANTSWGFNGWSGEALDSSSCVHMNANHSVIANFIPSGLRFVSVAPCRVADTRKPSGPLGGPAIVGNTSRNFVISSSDCGIPSTASAFALNATVVPRGGAGYMSIWPAGQPRPMVSTLNYTDNRIKANAAIVAAGSGGAISLFATQDTDVILDINGYFVTATSALTFYPIAPCRLVDTRPNATSTISSGAVNSGTSRTLPILSSHCNVPATAAAYSLNVTVVPPGPLHYLTVYPTGVSKPLTSTLNDRTGTVTANAAIVAAGAGGSIDVYATDTTDLVVDINGYFASPESGGLSLHALPPCRVLDTRTPLGSPPFRGTIEVNAIGSGCGATAAAQAYVLNATVVPDGPSGYLVLWQGESAPPSVSTLNARDGAITSNMAIVPTSNGSIDAFAPLPTQLVLDIAGYFAQ